MCTNFREDDSNDTFIRKKGYQVTLKDDGLYLTDDTYTSVKRNTNAYYRYDRDSITR
jgi:gamma-glutamyltranspeptidase/glutathione hydrolase